MITIIKVPANFFDDHDSRDLPTPRVITRNSRTVTILADDTNLAELLSDAELYAEPDTDFHSELRGLIASAKATVRAINKVTIC